MGKTKYHEIFKRQIKFYMERAGKTQADLPQYEKIEDGDTITYTAYYKLRSDSPIEIVFRDFMTQDVFVDVVYNLPA